MKKYTPFKSIDDFVTTKISSNIYYAPPEDPQELLFDFYLITAFKNRDVSGMRDEGLQVSFDDAVKKVTFATHQHILDTVFDGITQEVQNAFTISPFKGDKGSLLFVSEHDLDFALQRIGMPNQLDDYIDIQETISSYTVDDPQYEENLDTIKSILQDVCDNFLSVDEETLVFNSLIFFTEMDWIGNYGGALWGTICQAWINLYNSTNLDQTIILIDHIYDLHHNTGSVLNKSDSYTDVDINWALDLKKNGSYWDLFDNCSLGAKTLMSRVLKNTTGESSDIGKRNISEEEESPNFF